MYIPIWSYHRIWLKLTRTSPKFPLLPLPAWGDDPMEDHSIADNWADALDAIMDSPMDDHPTAGEGDWADAFDAIPDDVDSHSPVDDHSSAGDNGWADALDAISEESLCL